MKLEETIIFLIKVAKEYKTYGDLDNPEFEDTKKIAESIETVLRALQNSIPKDIIRQKINERQFELQQEYEDFKDDIRLNTLQELYYYKED